MKMGGGSGIFGNFVANNADLNKQLDPVMRVLVPADAAAMRNVDRNLERMFNPTMPGIPEPKTLPTMVSGTGAAKAGNMSAVAPTGGGFGARDMVTAPPNTAEGNKMRFGKSSLLGVAE